MCRACQLALFIAAMSAAGSADAAGDDAPHATSSYIMSAISSGIPKYDPAKSELNVFAARAASAQKQAGAPAGVTVMPAYTITEAKLPTERQAMTYRGWTQPFIDAHMGPSDGIDRGVLNRYTLAQLWAKIPILGKLPFVGTAAHMTIAERALDDAGANDPLRTKPIE